MKPYQREARRRKKELAAHNRAVQEKYNTQVLIKARLKQIAERIYSRADLDRVLNTLEPERRPVILEQLKPYLRPGILDA